MPCIKGVDPDLLGAFIYWTIFISHWQHCTVWKYHFY